MAACSLGKHLGILLQSNDPIMQNIIDQCLARSNTYGLLSQLYLHGPVPEIFSYIEAIPDLASTLASQGNDSISLQSVDQDQLAADHYHIFGLNVLPYESSFLDPNNVLGGPISERVLADYWSVGFNADTTSESADHIGLELRFLDELCKAQAESGRDQSVEILSQMETIQASFLENHLLRWLPGLVQAVHQQKIAFYSSLVEITLDVVIDHYQDLAGRNDHQRGAIIQDIQLPEPPNILLAENTGLKDIARYLLTPVYSGVYLSREIIEDIAKNQNLPRGFGERETMLTNLLRNAADYDQLPSVLDDFERIFNQWENFYFHLPERCRDPNLLTPIATPWLRRIQTSQNILNHIHSTASDN